MRTMRYTIVFAMLVGLAICAADRPAATSQPASSPANDWTIFRGQPALTGIAAGKLPDKPALLWRFKTGDAVVSSPVISGGRVFVGSDDENLYALSLADGKKLWSFNAADPVSAPPLVVDGKVIVGTDDGALHCLSAETGKELWKYKADDRILGSANYSREREGLRILVGSYDNFLHCIDAKTGKKCWTYETEYFINGTPAVADGKVVFGGCDGILHVVSTATGKAVRKVEAGFG